MLWIDELGNEQQNWGEYKDIEDRSLWLVTIVVLHLLIIGLSQDLAIYSYLKLIPFRSSRDVIDFQLDDITVGSGTPKFIIWQLFVIAHTVTHESSHFSR